MNLSLQFFAPFSHEGRIDAVRTTLAYAFQI